MALRDAIRAAGRVTLGTGTGCTMSAAATITEWLAWGIQIITGSFERPGGAWFNPGMLAQFDTREFVASDGRAAAGPRSRPELPARVGEYPCAALADEIEAGNVRALFVIGGNPVVSLPDAHRLEDAFKRLDVLAVADVIECEPVELATHVLAVAGQLEREDITWYTDLFGSVRTAQRTDAVFEPAHERRLLASVIDDLAAAMGHERETLGMERFLRRAPALREQPVIVGDPPRVRGWVHERVLPQGRWRIAPDELAQQLQAWTDVVPPALVGVPRRAVRRMNSTLRDIGRGGEDHAVWIHPLDVASLTGGTTAIADGEMVRVRTAVGELVAPARITEDITPGAVSIPHGLREQNVSWLTQTDGAHTDLVSGMVTLSGFAVEISGL